VHIIDHPFSNLPQPSDGGEVHAPVTIEAHSLCLEQEALPDIAIAAAARTDLALAIDDPMPWDLGPGGESGPTTRGVHLPTMFAIWP
jgi:hypothetical protein